MVLKAQAMKLAPRASVELERLKENIPSSPVSRRGLSLDNYELIAVIRDP